MGFIITKPERNVVLRAMLIAGWSVVLMILLHQPAISLHNLFIGQKILTIPEMVVSKIAVGLLTSALIYGACSILLRDWSPTNVLTVAIAQVLWIEFEWGYSFSTNGTGETLIRVAEQFGVIISGALMLGVSAYMKVRRLRRRGESNSPTQ